VQGGGLTSVGDKNFLMAYVHVAHDCRLGNHLILANAASLAGHITIGDHAIIGGLTGVHQFVRIGAYAMVGGCCGVVQDVPPFTRAAGGYRSKLYGLNSIGLRRHGFSGERISVLKKAYDLLFREGHRSAEAIKLARAESRIRRMSPRSDLHGSHQAWNFPFDREEQGRWRRIRVTTSMPNEDKRIGLIAGNGRSDQSLPTMPEIGLLCVGRSPVERQSLNSSSMSKHPWVKIGQLNKLINAF